MAGHVLCTNGTSMMAFPRIHEDPIEQLSGSFGRMDGERLFAFILWAIPGDASFDDGGKAVLESPTYIQCAGRADALTVEMREIGEAGRIRHYVLGRSAEVQGNCDITITWQRASTSIYHNEKWSAESAVGLFISYWKTGTVPPDVSRRQIDVGT